MQKCLMLDINLVDNITQWTKVARGIQFDTSKKNGAPEKRSVNIRRSRVVNKLTDKVLKPIVALSSDDNSNDDNEEDTEFVNTPAKKKTPKQDDMKKMSDELCHITD